MDQREKKARLETLQKLRKQRGASEKEEYESEGEEYVEEAELEEEEDDDETLNGFIEETEEEKAERTRRKTGAAPSITSFFKPVGGATASKKNFSATVEKEQLSKQAALKDDFFKSLVAQLSSEESSEDEAVITSVKTTELKSTIKSMKGSVEQLKVQESTVQLASESDYDSAFPELPPESSLNRLNINNEMCMDIDFEDVDVDEEDLKAMEKTMTEPKNEEVKVAAVNAPVTVPSKPLKDFDYSIPMMEEKQNNSLFTGGMVTSQEGSIVDSEGFVNFFWFDAYEKQPNGPVYLFGKIKDPESSNPAGMSNCCVIVENLQRNVFFLPREEWKNEETGEIQPVTLNDVYGEIGKIAGYHGIEKYGCKRVTRRYAFEIPEVPTEAEYVKMVYGFGSGPQLPMNLSGKTFSQAFGTNTSALEMLLIKRKIMGPCWLRVKPASISARTVSWCKTELTVTEPKTIKMASAEQIQEFGLPTTPLLTAMSISLRTVLNPSSHAHEIVAISGLIYNAVDIDGAASSKEKPKCSAAFSCVRELENLGFPAKFSEALNSAGSKVRIEQAKNEKSLLNYLVAMLQRHDPDILIGHNFLGFDLGVLLHRMRACKVDFWSKIGRLNRMQWPKSKAAGSTEASYAERQIVSGRLVCDTYLAAKDLIRAKNYSLQHLTESQLGLQREEIDYERIKDFFSTPDAVLHLLKHNEMDSFYIAMLMFQLAILPLTLQLTNIAGNLWSRTLTGARAERNEFLLLHEFHNQKFICPDKQPFNATAPAITIGMNGGDNEDDNNNNNNNNNNNDGAGVVKKGGKRKPAYSGGLVLEPKKGFYDKIVLLLDFNSLYPSIIQEYNICFTSVERGVNNNKSNEEDGEDQGEVIPPVPDQSLPQGILPRILKTLVERRRAVKSLMKDQSKLTPALYSSYNIRQQALKLTANSMYGCLGFSHSRFYAKPLAVLITAKGREILQSTVDLTRNVCSLDVIYGDTDSIMVATGTNNLQEARSHGLRIKKAVNERYRLLEIELDGIFQKLLLLKKKKYAAVVVEEEKADGSIVTKLETKGLDLVRRDWSELSVDASTFILDKIMAGEGAEQVVQSIHEHLRQMTADLEAGKIPLEKFIISKNLTKDPSAYADAKSQPHVMVALRMRQKGLTAAAAGDTIPYVICCQSSSDSTTSTNSGALAEFAYHPEEVRKDSTLKLDVTWYLQTQIHPPIARLCEHIEGTDSAQLAACLGLDAKKFAGSSSGRNNDSVSISNLSSASTVFATLMSDEERFANVEKLKVCCPACNEQTEFTGILRENEEGAGSLLGVNNVCSGCTKKIPIATFHYAALRSIRNCSDKYNNCWLRCDECNTETARLSVYDRRCPSEGCRGSLKTILPASYLYTHLLYLRSLFDPSRVVDRCRSKMGIEENRRVHALMGEVEPVRALIEDQLKKCAYPVIDFKEIFGFLNK